MARGVYPRSNTEVNTSETLPDVVPSFLGDTRPTARPDLVQEVEPQRDMHGFADKAEKLRFMEEKITIHLSEPYGPTDEHSVFLSINGEPPYPGNHWLRRGVEHTIKRKFVEQLAKAKATTYTQPFKQETSERANVMRPARSMRYPFQVTNDPNPKGVNWLRAMQKG
jgi:hypothetical protein